MTRQFGKTTVEDIYMALDDIENRIQSLENRKDVILPTRDILRPPIGQEGQIIIGNLNEAAAPASKTFWLFSNGAWQQIGSSV
jgi:hypothetical protein